MNCDDSTLLILPGNGSESLSKNASGARRKMWGEDGNDALNFIKFEMIVLNEYSFSQ